MSFEAYYKKLDKLARDRAPSLGEISGIAWEYLISPFEISLPKSILNSAQEAIRSFYDVSRLPNYVNSLVSPSSNISNSDWIRLANRTQQKSVLMAYDFHSTESGELSLIEINTNASAYMLSALMLAAHGESDCGLGSLQKSFESDAQLAIGKSQDLNIAISDNDIPAQKMYPEFLMYKDWFSSFGWNSALVDARDFELGSDGGLRIGSNTYDFVYNRSTDFYFQDEDHRALWDSLSRGRTCVSPSPFEYWRLADKQRLISFSRPDFLESVGALPNQCQSIRKVLLPSHEIQQFGTAEELWDQRKSLFFKPKRMFGGKSVYRGESVSRKVFERLMDDPDILVQKYMPAQKFPTDDPRSVMTNWKFDLRFFAYGSEIQLAVARIYQGQVTNFASPLGGITRVRFA